jgi:K+/H+ antiporter YhaU regulatory subunit KhtT
MSLEIAAMTGVVSKVTVDTPNGSKMTFILAANRDKKNSYIVNVSERAKNSRDVMQLAMYFIYDGHIIAETDYATKVSICQLP